MAEPPIAEALLIEDGTVAAVGTRDDVLALAGDQVAGRRPRRGRRVPGVHRRPRPLDRRPRVLRASSRRRRPWTRPSAAAGPRSASSGSTRSGSTSSTGPRGRRRPAASRGRLSRPELRQRVLRGLVRVARARRGRRLPPRPGREDPRRQRRGLGHQLDAGRPDRGRRPGERRGLAGLSPRGQHRGASRCSSTPTRPRSARRPEPAAPPDRARDPGVGRPAGPHGGHGPGHGRSTSTGRPATG